MFLILYGSGEVFCGNPVGALRNRKAKDGAYFVVHHFCWVFARTLSLDAAEDSTGSGQPQSKADEGGDIEVDEILVWFYVLSVVFFCN